MGLQTRTLFIDNGEQALLLDGRQSGPYLGVERIVLPSDEQHGTGDNFGRKRRPLGGQPTSYYYSLGLNWTSLRKTSVQHFISCGTLIARMELYCWLGMVGVLPMPITGPASF